MTALIYNIAAEQGSMLRLRIVYGNLSPVDLTGYTVVMQVRCSATDENVLLDLSTEGGSPAISLSLTPTDGEITVLVSSSVMEGMKSGNYVYDMEIYTNADNHLRILQGAFTVNAEITRVSPG